MTTFKKTLLLSAIASVGLAGSASAAVTGLTNADFEAGIGDQNVPNWFDYADGTNTNDGKGDLIQLDTADADIPEDTDGTGWLNLVDNKDFTGNPRGVYQGFGTHEAGIASYQVDLTIGQRSDTSGFDDIIVELFYGTVIGVDGSTPTSLGLTAAGSATITGSTYFATPTTKGTAAVQLSLDATGVGVGDTLWLSFKTDDDRTASNAEQSLIDDISVTAVPEPGSLALLGLGGLLLARWRRGHSLVLS